MLCVGTWQDETQKESTELCLGPLTRLTWQNRRLMELGQNSVEFRPETLIELLTGIWGGHFSLCFAAGFEPSLIIRAMEFKYLALSLGLSFRGSSPLSCAAARIWAARPRREAASG